MTNLIRLALRLPAVFRVVPLLLFLLNHSIIDVSGQTTMGVLPVSTGTAGTSLLSDNQWHNVALSLQDYLASSLSGIGTVKKLTREHLLLLLKDMPLPNQEALNTESYQSISRKENLHYLLKFSVQSLTHKDGEILATGYILIIEGNSGSKFWDKPLSISKRSQGEEIGEPYLTNEVLKPMINQALMEIRELSY